MIDTTRIRYLLPIPRPAQAVHYTQPDDLDFIQQWITYLHTHDRIPPATRTTLLDTGNPTLFGPPRLILNVHDGHTDRGTILRLGQSLILQGRRLTVIDKDTLHHQFRELPDPLTTPESTRSTA